MGRLVVLGKSVVANFIRSRRPCGVTPRAGDAARAVATVVDQVAQGAITPQEGGKVTEMNALHRRFASVAALERRVEELEYAVEYLRTQLGDILASEFVVPTPAAAAADAPAA